MKIKIQKSAFDISINNEKQIKEFDLTVVFGFADSILETAKKYIKVNDSGLSLLDLNIAGNHYLYNHYNKLATHSLLMLSLGEIKKFDLNNYLISLKALANILTTSKTIKNINIVLESSLHKLLNIKIDELFCQTTFHILNYLYYFDEQKSNRKILNIALLNFNIKQELQSKLEDAIKQATYYHDGILLLKHLGNNPSNIVTPSYMAKMSEDLTKLSNKVKVIVLDHKEIKKEKMLAFLAVTQGSSEDAKFIKLEYYGAKSAKDQPIVLIGKGITFDSGGISLKPSANMHDMKYDMCGAATVIASFVTTVQLKLAINLIVLVPTCENMPSGTAVKPGDVVKTMSGQTVEILNTDAEGRLILCDALYYAKKYNPKLVIDIATLTGGCVIALGGLYAAIYSNNTKLAKQFIDSGDVTNDKLWLMPLAKEYHEMLKSDTADIANIGSWKGVAASPTAAAFLEKFVDYDWIHLDIAGVAYGVNTFNANNYSGATGRPFFALMHFLVNL